MAPPQDKRPDDQKRDPSGMRSAATLLAIPSLLIISPLVGFFLGDFGDKRFHTSPWLALTGLALGFVAGGREVWIIYKKYLETQER
ncbi:MAG TPA: AtpZ/AtpI family protein [Methylomirabilota bacterium]|jgi:F0F1-type ATP synthase assembly protein I|nr:AtpZ/AtpI family protein [Methylomirabilota bacterium]